VGVALDNMVLYMLDRSYIRIGKKKTKTKTTVKNMQDNPAQVNYLKKMRRRKTA
jgi:hypothetical protein